MRAVRLAVKWDRMKELQKVYMLAVRTVDLLAVAKAARTVGMSVV